MKQFVDTWQLPLEEKLFKKVTALHVQVTKNELKELETALKTMDYKKEKNSFIHAFNPAVHYQATSENKIPKYTKIEIELSKPVAEKSFDIGTTYRFGMKGTKLEIVIKQL